MSHPPAFDITLVLQDVNRGDSDARGRLLDLLYHELKQIAAGQMRVERPDHTLQPTALVHEAYLRLIGNNRQAWENRAHFFGAAAEVMRRILIDHARARAADKRGGGAPRVLLGDETETAGGGVDQVDLLAIDEALTELEERDPEKAKLVKLRYFAGLTAEEAAQALGLSLRTVHRQWRYARAWLYRRMGRSGTD